MKLHLAEFLRHLNLRPMMLVAEHGSALLPETHRERRVLAKEFRPMLDQAGKFIFDSGADADDETTEAIKQTAIAMLEDGRFHLPYPITWIEDPFHDDPTGEARNYYLAREKDDEIRVWVALRRPPPVNQYFFLCMLPFVLNLKQPLSGHYIPLDVPPGHPGHDPEMFNGIKELLGQADYALRKFIVTLGSGGVERDDVVGTRLSTGAEGPPGASPRKQQGDYPYTVIRIPSDPTPATNSGGTGSGPRRRRHFVRGFVWGKNTRPREEQRWVAGYFRGAAELGEVERSPCVRTVAA